MSRRYRRQAARKVLKSSARADHSFQQDKLYFWLFIYSGVDDFVDVIAGGISNRIIYARDLVSTLSVQGVLPVECRPAGRSKRAVHPQCVRHHQPLPRMETLLLNCNGSSKIETC